MTLFALPEKGSNLRVLFLGDVVGRPGRRAVEKLLAPLKDQLGVDLAIANGENAAGGAGIDAGTANELRASGVDIITLGDHAFQRKGVGEFLDRNSSWCIRPWNVPVESSPGKGWCSWTSKSGTRVFICNFIGRTFMHGSYGCPFRGLDHCLQEMAADQKSIVICDMHAEATSEKLSFARYADGRVSLVVGTHTHVQTADAQILPSGTGYITDLGMTGSPDGVIGMASHVAVKRFMSPMPAPYEVAEGEGVLHGIVGDVDPSTGKTIWIHLIEEPSLKASTAASSSCI